MAHLTSPFFPSVFFFSCLLTDTIKYSSYSPWSEKHLVRLMSPICALVLRCAPKDTYHVSNATAPASVPSPPPPKAAVSLCPLTGEWSLSLRITPIRCCLYSAHREKLTSRSIRLYFIWRRANSHQCYPVSHCIFTWMTCDKSSFQCHLPS